mmetsp:Transcript_35124/g.109770  ORF Transcript_35124/g.109770 Transcript_35124/m.109770 type:complete len:235 (+) Transcript_35124:694-1398(+)
MDPARTPGSQQGIPGQFEGPDSQHTLSSHRRTSPCTQPSSQTRCPTQRCPGVLRARTRRRIGTIRSWIVSPGQHHSTSRGRLHSTGLCRSFPPQGPRLPPSRNPYDCAGWTFLRASLSSGSRCSSTAPSSRAATGRSCRAGLAPAASHAEPSEIPSPPSRHESSSETRRERRWGPAQEDLSARAWPKDAGGLGAWRRPVVLWLQGGRGCPQLLYPEEALLGTQRKRRASPSGTS